MRPADSAMSVPRVAVCVPTWRRNGLLKDCLQSLEQLCGVDEYELLVLVADNDTQAGARPVAEAMQQDLSAPLHYVVETQRGLASVRNRLLEEAIAVDADYLAFIDDDEKAGANWLAEHLRCLQEFNADVSCGPVRPVGASHLVPGKEAMPTGSVPRHVSTNNVVFNSKLVCGQGLRFDTYYNFIGGEDFDFFERSRDLGNHHVWAEHAGVEETIVPERDSLGYLFYRHYSGGINSVLRHRRKNPYIAGWFHFLPKSAGKMIAAPVFALLAILRPGRGRFPVAIKKLGSGLGYLAGLLHIVEARYASGQADETRTHSSHRS